MSFLLILKLAEKCESKDSNEMFKVYIIYSNIAACAM